MKPFLTLLFFVTLNGVAFANDGNSGGIRAKVPWAEKPKGAAPAATSPLAACCWASPPPGPSRECHRRCRRWPARRCARVRRTDGWGPAQSLTLGCCR